MIKHIWLDDCRSGQNVPLPRSNEHANLNGGGVRISVPKVFMRSSIWGERGLFCRPQYQGQSWRWEIPFRRGTARCGTWLRIWTCHPPLITQCEVFLSPDAEIIDLDLTVTIRKGNRDVHLDNDEQHTALGIVWWFYRSKAILANASRMREISRFINCNDLYQKLLVYCFDILWCSPHGCGLCAFVSVNVNALKMDANI